MMHNFYFEFASYSFGTNEPTNCFAPLSIDSILPNFLNIMRPDLQLADQREWWRVLCQLQETLRDTADFLVKVK